MSQPYFNVQELQGNFSQCYHVETFSFLWFFTFKMIIQCQRIDVFIEMFAFYCITHLLQYQTSKVILDGKNFSKERLLKKALFPAKTVFIRITSCFNQSVCVIFKFNVSSLCFMYSVGVCSICTLLGSQLIIFLYILKQRLFAI